MPGKTLSKICGSVMTFFNKTVEQIDQSVRFVKRKSKVSAQVFVQALVGGCLSDPTISLEGLCKLRKGRGITITKEGLHERFNTEATALMQKLFQESLKQFNTTNHNVIDLLKPFSSVKMIDSSGISLSSNLKDIYKNYGGSASEAGLKIQVLFDYLQGQINQVTITEGRKNDQSFNDHLNQIEKNDLYLQDLGYFKLKSFGTILNKGAYFISRYLNPTAIFDEENVQINLIEALRQEGRFLSKKVWLNRGKEKIEVRLIATRLPDEEIEKRIRKLRRSAQKHGRIPTKETLELAEWSIYITNVPENMLNDEQIHIVYSLRWQIELLFKLCKSEAGIAKVSGKTLNRVLCEIYAKLICVVLLLYFCAPLRWKANQEISFKKAYKELKLRGSDFFKVLKSPYRLLEFIKLLFDDLLDFGYKDKHRKKRRLSYQKLMDSIGQEILV